MGELAQIIVDLISKLGFPIAVTAYLLVFHDRRLREIRDEVKANGAAIDRLSHLVTGTGLPVRGDKGGNAMPRA